MLTTLHDRLNVFTCEISVRTCELLTVNESYRATYRYDQTDKALVCDDRRVTPEGTVSAAIPENSGFCVSFDR